MPILCLISPKGGEPPSNIEIALKILEILVPALVALVVGWATAWIGIRQIREAASTTEKQIKASLEAAMLQYRAQVLSTNRQGWINSVRDVAAEYVAITGEIAIRTIKNPSFDLFELGDHQRHLFLRSKMRLLLNGDEKATLDVVAAMGRIGDWFGEPVKDVRQFAELRKVFEDSLALLLKNEWGRVRRGE